LEDAPSLETPQSYVGINALEPVKLRLDCG